MFSLKYINTYTKFIKQTRHSIMKLTLCASSNIVNNNLKQA